MNSRIGTYLKAIIRKNEESLLSSQIIRKSNYSVPDFLVAGVPKAGTTSLFQYLAQHPEIIPSKEKELLYFSIHQYLGLRWYLSNFPLKEEKLNKLTFEGSPSYIYYRTGLSRIHRLFPKIKLIVVLRDPVKRAFSHWNFHREGSLFVIDHPQTKENRSFEQAIRDEMERSSLPEPSFQYIYRSLYAKHLQFVYELFPSEQILVLDFDELKNEPQHVMSSVTGFLNIENIYESFEKSEKKEAGLLQTKDEENNRELKAYNTNAYKVSINKETETFLRNYFSQFDDALVRLTGRKFSWMK